MNIKLDFEQRHRANEMLARLAGADLEEFVFEFIATRDAYNRMRRTANILRLADNSQKYSCVLVVKDGVELTTVGNMLAEMGA